MDVCSKLVRSVERYSEQNGSKITEFKLISCDCGSEELLLFSDDENGAAFVECAVCKAQYDLFDSGKYAEEWVQNTCNCDAEELTVGVGVSKCEGSNDLDWVYIGAHCRKCGCTGVYTDWKER